MKSCPGVEELNLLIDDQIDASQRVRLEAHISNCATCQELLSTTLRRDDWRRWLEFDAGDAAEFTAARIAVRAIPDTELLALNLTGGASTPRSAPPASTPEIAGFELLDRIGGGGMGTVYRARQMQLDREVAIKVLHRSSHQPERWLRFRTEALAIARLQHTHIVQVFDTGNNDDVSWIVQELCHGGTLEDRIDGMPQSPSEAAELVSQLAAAVQHAHDIGVIHRDIKPANVLFRGNTPKLADFGLARQLNSNSGITHTGEVLGTPGYMSPEQALGHQEGIGVPSDIYGLGAVLYEMLTGIPPFRAATAVETLRLVVEQDAIPPRRLQPSIPRELEVICLKCLEKEPKLRYSSASLLADDLSRLLEGRPIQARPIGTLRRITKWAKRNPVIASLCVTATVFAIALLSVWGYLTFQLNRSNLELSRRTRELARSTQKALDNATAAQSNLERQIATNAALEEVLEFFTSDLFEAATTEQRGVNLTVLEVLEESDRKINTRSLNRPNVEAALRLAIGNTLFLIGQPKKAVVHLERADVLYRQHDPDSMAAFDCRQTLARCLRKLGESARSRTLIHELTTDKWFPDDMRQIRLQIDLFNLDSPDRPLDDKVASIEQTYESSREKLGPQHVLTVSLLSAHAETWFRAGRFEKALEVYQNELTSTEAALGQDHLNTYNAANNVAVTLIRLGRLPEAEKIHRENYRRQLMFRGPRDVGTMGTKHNLSMILWRQNKREESVALLREVVAEKSAALGPVENRTQQSLYQIGRMFLELKQHQEGFKFFEQHFLPYVESSRPTTQWVDLFNVCGQLATHCNQLEAADAALTQSRKLLESMGEGFGSQRNALKSAEAALAAAREK